MNLPQLSYPIDHPYPWKYTTAIVSIACLVSLAILAIINEPLVGYDEATTTEVDFNGTESLWYDLFLPSKYRNKGKTCDPHVFRPGDIFQTSFGLFTWTITDLGDDEGFPVPSVALKDYSNTNLSSCDVTSLALLSNPVLNQFDTTITITCNLPFLMKATVHYIESSDSSRDSSLQFFNYEAPSTRDPAVGIMDVLDSLGHDLVSDFQTFNQGDIYALLVAFVTMPGCSGNCTDEENAAVPTYRHDVGVDPQLISRLRVIYSNDQRYDIQPPWGFTANVSAQNMFDALLFAARMDVGRATANNFFANTSAINSTIELPLVPDSYAELFRNTQTGRYGYAQLPISVNTSTIWLSYTCHTLRLKSPAALLGSLVVAVSAMFTPAFGICMFIASCFARRHPDGGNTCTAHAVLQPRGRNQEDSRVSLDPSRDTLLECVPVVSKLQRNARKQHDYSYLAFDDLGDTGVKGMTV